MGAAGNFANSSAALAWASKTPTSATEMIILLQPNGPAVQPRGPRLMIGQPGERERSGSRRLQLQVGLRRLVKHL
jgi:hypothetical protein